MELELFEDGILYLTVNVVRIYLKSFYPRRNQSRHNYNIIVDTIFFSKKNDFSKWKILIRTCLVLILLHFWVHI